MSLAPRAVLVHRRSELEELIDRHGTRGQVEFFLRTRGRTLAEVQERHDALDQALTRTRAAVPVDWRRGEVERGDLHRFTFDPGDLCLVVGPDGLVANTAKYLDGQPVIGVDPEPGRNPGVLVRHRAERVARLLHAVTGGSAAIEARALVRATLDDGTGLEALNDVFVGHRSHQSARYRLTLPEGGGERQSSSGLVITTGTGATGWATSLARGRADAPPLPASSADTLAWFVREAWPSPTTGTDHTAGLLAAGARLEVVVESDALVVFGDGLEADRLTATWGQTVSLGVSDRRLQLVL
jgi:NAD kinase